MLNLTRPGRADGMVLRPGQASLSANGRRDAGAVAGSARSGRRGEHGHLLSREAGLALAVALLLPLLLYLAGLGALNRTLYPLTAIGAGAYLYARRSPWYLGLCVWLFCATPLVRRLTDFQAGWDPSNPVLLAPYLACLCAALSFLPYALRARPTFVGPFVVILACVAYGLLLAVAQGRVISGIVDALRWSVGPLIAVHLLRYAQEQPAYHRAVFASFLTALPVMAAYGVAQFLAPAAWDREWMINVVELGLDSIGQPVPFEVRVFGTMNAPASFAAVLTVGLIASVRLPFVLALPATALMGLALALTQYRAGWGGTVIGLACVLLAGTAGQRSRLVLGATLVFVGIGPLLAVPEIRHTLEERFDTLTQLSSDASGEERLQEYARFFSETEGLILGEGLALAGATRRLDGQNTAFIDGGLAEPVLAFGVFGGALLLTAVGVLFAATLKEPGNGPLAIYRAVAAANLVQLPFGRVLVGESGFSMWLCIGLALATIAARRQPLSPAPVAPGSEAS